MKKTLVAGVAALAFATAAFAEITFGAWLRVLPTLVAGDGNEVSAFQSNSWGWGARSARININAVSEDEKAGFTMGVYNDAFSGLGDGDEARLWLKPIDQVKLSVGHVEENALRGDLCFGSWNWLRPYSTYIREGEGLTFDNWNQRGLLVQVEPVENVYLHVGVPLEDTASKKAEDIYKNVHVAGAYTIDGVGKLKAGFFGDYSKTEAKAAAAAKNYIWIKDGTTPSIEKGDKDDYDAAVKADEVLQLLQEGSDAAAAADEYKKTGRVGVAFDLTAVENLYVTAGFRYLIADKEWFAANPEDWQMNFALGASYQATPELKVSADFAMNMYQSDTEIDPRFAFGVGVDYALSDTLSLAADVRYINKKSVDGEEVDKSDHVSFLVGLNSAVGSNGSIGIGFQGTTNGGHLGCAGDKAIYGKSIATDKDDPKSDGFVWAIPVSMSVWF